MYSRSRSLDLHIQDSASVLGSGTPRHTHPRLRDAASCAQKGKKIEVGNVGRLWLCHSGGPSWETPFSTLVRAAEGGWSFLPAQVFPIVCHGFYPFMGKEWAQDWIPPPQGVAGSQAYPTPREGTVINAN